MCNQKQIIAHVSFIPNNKIDLTTRLPEHDLRGKQGETNNPFNSYVYMNIKVSIEQIVALGNVSLQSAVHSRREG